MKSTALVFLSLLLWSCGHRLTPEEISKLNADELRCQTAIKQWITAHAVHPESYEPIVFDQFSMGRTLNGDTPVPGSETYTMHHAHQMLTNTGNPVSFDAYFLLDNEFHVGIIQVGRMSAADVGTYPDWKVWTDLFGRPMTAQDSSEWRSSSNERLLREMEQLKEGLNNGDAYGVGTPQDSAKATIGDVIEALKR